METSYRIKTWDAARLHSNAQDVLTSEDARVLRAHDLRRGMILGNMYKEDTTVIHITSNGDQKRLNGRIIALTEKNVVFDTQMVVPIHRIREVIV